MNLKDRIIRSTGKKAPFRLVLVDITNTMNEIGAKHGAQSYSLKLLAETTISSIFLSSSLKMKGTVSVTATFGGEISYAKADTTPYISRKEDEESYYFVRAMIPQDDLQAIKADEPALIPQNYQVVKLNEFGKRVHESVVQAVSPSMGQNLATYLYQSEQILSAVGIEAQFNKQDPSKLDYAIGFYVEAFPEMEEKDTTTLEQVVLNLPKFAEMYDVQEKGGKTMVDELLYQFEGPYEIEVIKEFGAKAFCPCSKERTISSLAALPLADLKDLEKDGKDLEMVCDFCRNKYIVTMDDLREIIKERQGK
ncbi:Hsp33 family molecular chaperone HslO [Fibrobacter sp. UWEL]|uniref:Hsp33 family molecular chaperone HslO n=1 Tax=Fibrobacter sp. UWEL TaxID=1896209 RepID=UPI000911F628|nr:Hsp33 family molecular chaperone HslO [Fibrobacter sp. UWEL]SHK29668.1 molecular chaperone Hsp33 [Fibrobacter sp. UWEL]